MFLPRYHVAPSRIAGAGRGIFLDQAVTKGAILVAPDAIPRTHRWEEIMASPDRAQLEETAIRWFEDHYTVTPDWPDECFLNHAFEPTGIWHLGFVFAAADWPAGTELTIDYRHLLKEGVEEVFKDGATGRPIIGLPWNEALRLSLEQLRRVLG